MSLFPRATFPRSRRARPSGIALVIVLAMVVVVSLILVAFVTAMKLDRAAAASYSQAIDAEQIGRGALARVSAELRQEMSKDALAAGAFTNVVSTNILPQRVGTNSAMPSLVKISASSSSFVGSLASGTLLASTNNTTTPARNGRMLSTNRWNQACFGQFPSNAAAPNWVLVTRGGTTNVANFPVAADASVGNAGFVIGRFAYAIYDEGGLLDVTLAGHPSTLTTPQVLALKDTLAGADVAALGIDPDQLVSWRNSASRSDYGGYVTNFLATNSPSQVYPGDNTFISRQDLIRAAKAGVAGLSTNVLPSLTTFTREMNSPSWGPSTPAGSTIDYAAQANTSVANRLVPNVTFTGSATITSYHNNGTAFTYDVKAGDPLLQRRFPLERLNWIGPSGPQNGGTAANIQACFGLKWATSLDTSLSPGAGVWQYVGATGSAEASTIETLAQVAAEKREPDFFELLQAGILSGSLAVNGGNNGASFPSLVQAASMFQILRIGASLIDQYDTDSSPTVIEYEQSGYPWQACGIESLPYVNLFKAVSGADPANPTVTNSTAALAIYLAVGLWNPSQSISTAVPPNVRLRIMGSVGMFSSWSTGLPGYSFLNGPVAYGNGYTKVLNEVLPLVAGTAGQGGRGFANPNLLTAADVAAVTDPGSAGGNWGLTPATLTATSVVAPGTSYVAYRLPDLFLKANQTPPQTNPDYSGAYWGYLQTCYAVSSGHPFQISLEFQTPSGQWIPYSFSHGNNDPGTWQVGGSPWQTHFTAPPTAGTVASMSDTWTRAPIYMTSDPRSVRFGLWQYSRNYSGSGPDRASDALITPLWPTSAQVAGSPYQSTFQSYGYGGGSPAAADAVNVPSNFWSSSYYPAQLSRNNVANTSPTSSYKDVDGIRRIGDSGLYTSGATAGNPYQNAPDKPVILNRPFHSVAEMGYAFRDDPWRSLDFFSANSADAGLMDLFSVGQDGNTMVAGRVSLNSRDPLVLKAVLSDTLADEMNTVKVANPGAIATNLISLSTTTPLVNKAGLATQISPALSSTDFGSTAEANIKRQREAFVRVLGDVGQTRTWNLMIDLVAQSGRFPPNSTGFDQFVVEGERRYWLHVAIDRFTGKVIDQKLEQISQ